MESQIKQQENLTVIDGGVNSGTNLFHSLKNLSVSSDSTVHFNNSLDIENIFIAVRDESISNIDGLIKANGTANLFLINPNGITFGKNSSLDIGGSFFASTASSIKFADEFEFTSADSSTPSLTNSFPIGMGFGNNPEEIKIEGDSSLKDISEAGLNQFFSSFGRGVKPSGLSVKTGKTLGIVSRNLNLVGGTLTAENGQIELGSVDSGSFVELIPIDKGWTLGYKQASSKDINLSQGSLVDASGVTGGSINVWGAHVKLTDGSVFTIDNIGTQNNESLKINASESLELSGSTANGIVISGITTRGINPSTTKNLSNSLSQEEINVSGKAADILISTKYLSLADGVGLGSFTENANQGGNITVNASRIDVFGFSEKFNNRQSSIFVSTLSSGNSGNLTISTEILNAREKGFIAGSTIGLGAGGNLIINATELIELEGPLSFLGTRTLRAGDAGTIKIRTRKLVGKDGGRIDTSTLTSGSAGNIFIDAEFVELNGVAKIPNRVIPSSINSSANLPPKSTQRNLGIPAIPSGESGDITINAKKINLSNGAEVSVKNEGTGNAGSIKINSDKLNLGTQGKITAATASGEGGDIILQTDDIRSRQGEITTSAGGTGNGGDITIKGDTITALEKSAIRANAFEGRGGNIKIKATGLFVSPDSPITATSERGVDGNIDIDVEESNLGISFKVDPGFRFRKLPLFCGKDSDVVVQPSLINVGKGSLPFDPEEAFINNLGWHDTSEDGDKNNSSKKIEQKEEVEVIEAQGWVDNGDGTVSFTASPPDEVIVGDSLLKSMCKIY